MPLKLSIMNGSPFAHEAINARTSVFYQVPPQSTLKSGLVAILEDAPTMVETYISRLAPVHPLSSPSWLSFIIGMDGARSGGFAILKARVSPARIMTRFYSTWPINSAYSDLFSAVGVKRELLVDPLDVFESGASLVNAHRVSGEVFRVAADCLAVPVVKNRRRTRRPGAR